MEEFEVKEGPLSLGWFTNKSFKKGDIVSELHGEVCKEENNAEGFHADPNCGLKITPEKIYFVAIKRIKKGDELTYDYSTTEHKDEWSMLCKCGNKNCRSIIGDFEDLPFETRQHYIDLEVVPDYILKKLEKD